jgi:hypothetical protein
MTTTLDPPPIRLKPRKPLISPAPRSLPILTMGAATQEPDAPETVTLSISHRVDETQEPATHSVAETQEPTMAETQETTTAETQEPVAEIEIMLQELETQTSLVFEIAETQTTTYPAAETQEPATGIAVESKEIETQDAVTPPSSSKTAKNPVAVT